MYQTDDDGKKTGVTANNRESAGLPAANDAIDNIFLDAPTTLNVAIGDIGIKDELV